MLDNTAFLIRFPEFASNPEMVTAKLAEAVEELNPSVYGDASETGGTYDLAQGYLAAHMLAISPLGKNARMLDDGDGSTPYGRRYREIRKQLAPRGFVT